VLTNLFSLNQKVLVITGASSGIGRACAIAVAKGGASVILMGRNKDRLQQTADALPSDTAFCMIPYDFSNGSIPQDELKNAIDKLGPISGLVHAAGISNTLPIRLIDEVKLQQIFNINVSSGVLLTKWISKPSNFDSKGCSIVFLSSVMGMVGESGKTLYSLSKGAVIAGARSMAIELAPKKIRVNCICPGVVETPMTDHAVYSQSEETRKKIIALHPLGLGNVDDIAYTALFLLSDAARWITGIHLPVDGGYTAK
jgi:NAD(P)-dependent dehydrogenase (short-subunit alcohol dehydrogenase family)